LILPLVPLAIFSGLSLNLLLHFALGTAGIAAEGEGKRKLPLFQFVIMFVVVLFLWVLFSVIFPSYWFGFSKYFLFYPFSALLCIFFERIGRAVFTSPDSKMFRSITGYEGLVPFSLFLTITLAANFTAAVIVSSFFTLGNLTAILILNEIRRKSALERVPSFIRGSPLILISMGLLSLIFGAAAGIFFMMLEVF